MRMGFRRIQLLCLEVPSLQSHKGAFILPIKDNFQLNSLRIDVNPNPNPYLLFAYCFSNHKFRSHELHNIRILQSRALPSTVQSRLRCTVKCNV